MNDLVNDIIDEDNPCQNLGTEDIWMEDDIFDENDEKDIVDSSKDILKNIKENDPFLHFNIPTKTVIDDLFNNDDLTDDKEATIEDVTERVR